MLPDELTRWKLTAWNYERRLMLALAELKRRGSVTVEPPSEELVRLRAENDRLKMQLSNGGDGNGHV